MRASKPPAEGSRSPRAKLAIDDDTLRQLAYLFTTAWLFDVLPEAMGQTTPVLYNGDGEEVLFHRVRFPLARGVTQADVAGVLDAHAKNLQAKPACMAHGRWLAFIGRQPPPGV